MPFYIQSISNKLMHAGNIDARYPVFKKGGLPRANAVKYVRDKYNVNVLSCVCAIDKATLPPLLEYWVPGIEVAGVHELVGNALIMKGEKERTTDLRGEPLKEVEGKGDV